MRLLVRERIVALDILPREGNFITLKTIRELREVLSFTDEEAEKFGIKVKVGEDGYTNYSWEQELDSGVDIPMTEAKAALIRNELKTMDTRKSLGEKHYSLYEKFVVAKEEEDAKEK